MVLITFVVMLTEPGRVDDRKLDVDVFTGLFGPIMIAELLAVDGSVPEVGAWGIELLCTMVELVDWREEVELCCTRLLWIVAEVEKSREEEVVRACSEELG
jgi:hypothetical protein